MISRQIAVAFIGTCALFSVAASASTEQVLYSFPNNSYPIGRPDEDSRGTLYGTAQDLDGYGAVYRLKQKDGVWGEKTLFDFNAGDGAYPYSGVLVDRKSGFLYGTTAQGGSGSYGTVYSLAPAGRGWSENVLHSFSYPDGAYPYPVLLRDKTTGNLYGTTYSGGSNDCGTALQLVQVNGNWTFSTIYEFQGGSDACQPLTQLKPGANAGTLIGASGGGNGKLFQLKQSHGVWSESVIYSFTGGSDGGYPYDLDGSSDGSIYGVTQRGGEYGHGVVFKLAPNLKKYTFSVIHDFFAGTDGSSGIGINVDSASGNLYGTTQYGGTHNEGTVFRLAPNGSTWTETVLHSFTGGTSDGAYPASRPIVDRTGALYGTATEGGANNGGVIYRVQP